MHLLSGGTRVPLSYSDPQHQHERCVAVALAKVAAGATWTGKAHHLFPIFIIIRQLCWYHLTLICIDIFDNYKNWCTIIISDLFICECLRGNSLKCLTCKYYIRFSFISICTKTNSTSWLKTFHSFVFFLGWHQDTVLIKCLNRSAAIKVLPHVMIYGWTLKQSQDWKEAPHISMQHVSRWPNVKRQMNSDRCVT